MGAEIAQVVGKPPRIPFVKMKLSLLFTTARPHLIQEVIARWRDAAGDTNRYEMIVVTDDPLVHSPQVNVKFIVNDGRKDCVTGWNLAAANASGDVFIQVSDDLFPPCNWDGFIESKMLELVKIRPAVVLNLLDDRRCTGAVFHPVLTRSAYEQLGCLYPPDFESMFCDVWFAAFHSKYSLYAVYNNIFWTHVHRTTHKVTTDDVMRKHESAERYQRGRQVLAKYIQLHGLTLIA